MPSEQGCRCTPETPVSLLCPDCLIKRRRIRDRLNRRKARAKKRGQKPQPLGTATLPTATVIDLTDALTSVADVLADADQPGRNPTPLEQQLVYNLHHLHQVLQEALQPAADELTEKERDTSKYRHEYRGKWPKFAEGK